jgi:zinc transporter ZupT
MAHLLPFAAGNFVYIAAADLIPEITATRLDRPDAPTPLRDRAETSASFFLGLVILSVATRLA